MKISFSCGLEDIRIMSDCRFKYFARGVRP